MKRSEFIQLFFNSIFLYSFKYHEKLEYNIDKEILIGKGKPDLVGNGYKLLSEVSEAYLKMKDAAKIDNINLKIVSSYRSFNHQKKIWNRKFSNFTNSGLSGQKAINKIIEYSTVPGSSRHHWGTEIDIIENNHNIKGDVLLPKLFHDSGPFEKMRVWMEENSEKYGFYKVYTNDKFRKGFLYEPWHYSYKKISIPYYKNYLKIDLLEILKEEKDLLGKKYLNKFFMKKYIDENIKGISKKLK
tara:strand:- start:10 stop:738 length:729 start_codon:yes stop_codon:yes gene_type:complete